MSSLSSSDAGADNGGSNASSEQSDATGELPRHQHQQSPKDDDDKDPLRKLGLPSPLILGSGSFTRKLILQEMNVPFRLLVRAIDEKSIGDRYRDDPSQLVLTLAHAKMDRLVQEIESTGGLSDDEGGGGGDDDDSNRNNNRDEKKDWIVLTGDQVVTCNGRILEKPESVSEAKRFVSQYAEHSPSTVGSCVIAHVPSNTRVSGVDTATIHFKSSLSDVLVDRLLDDGAPVLSCAGGLMIEHPFVREHVDRIDGTEDSVMGLSKDLVTRLLKELSESIRKQRGQQEQHQQQQQTEKKEKSQESSAKELQKFHHWTVCMVPPESADRVWDALTKARTECRDPGLFRWPPHANLLYPFLDGYALSASNNGGEDDDGTDANSLSEESTIVKSSPPAIDASILHRLEAACRDFDPFNVRLHRFGTFGGAKRGVLWIYPDSSMPPNNDDDEGNSEEEKGSAHEAFVVEPLKQLQARLEEQFPMCNDQRKVGGTFSPHMTISHFVNLDAALKAQEDVESWWPGSSSTASSSPLEFLLDRVYLLYRKGDDGQFQIVAEIPLGGGDGASSSTATTSITHYPPRPFVHMPTEEIDWVRSARMELKSRRGRDSRGRRGRRKST